MGVLHVERRGVMAKPTAFDPLSLSPFVWLKADAISASDGDAVNTWSDSSGNGRDASKSSSVAPIYKTAIVNSKPVVRFNGSSSGLSTAAWTATSQPDILFVVGSMNAINGYFTDGINASFRRAIGNGLIAGGEMDLYSGAGFGAAQSTPTGWHVWTAIFNGASSSLLRDGAAFATGTAGSHQVTGLTLGRHVTSAAFLNGDIAEVLFYTGTLSTGGRQAVESYLRSKYATA